MTRAAITGGAGFIGSHLTDYLLAKGWEVVVLDNFITGSRRNLEHLSGPDFELLEQDITEPFTVSGDLDYVFNLASPASPVDYAELPLETLRVGSIGTENALKLALEKGARFLLSSTSEVYGDPNIHPQKEDYWGNVNPIGPRSCYDEAKRYAEAVTMAYRRKFGLETRIIRIFNTYGPRMRAFDGRVVPNFIRQAEEGNSLTIFGDGSQTRSFCYVDDLVEGIYRMAVSDEPGPVNLGNPNETTILEFARTVLKLVGKNGNFTYKPLPKDDPKVRRPDISLARRVLNWEPQVPLDKGLEKTIAYFRKVGFEK